MRARCALIRTGAIGQRIVFLLNLQKEIAAPRQRELDDGQPRHMASPETLATTLEGTRCGLGLCIDNNTAGVYCAFGARFERSRKPESVHPFNQRSNLRFDHFGGSNRLIPESPPWFLAPLCRKESQSHRSTRHQIRA